MTDSLLAKLPDRTLDKLEQFERFWNNYRLHPLPVPQLVTQKSSHLVDINYDVAIALLV
jgi:lycopene cyclase CruP